MTCPYCGEVRVLRPVRFHRHIGLLVAWSHATLGGEMCRDCGRRVFWKASAPTLLVGWCSPVSLVFGPVSMILNLVQLARLAKG